MMPESEKSEGMSSDAPYGEQLQKRLPVVLSVIAGLVDVIGYLSLKLFTAHVTGNIVVIASHLVYGGPPNMDQILAVPVFILAVAAVWLIAQASHSRGPALPSLLLLVQFLLLACVLIVAVIFHPSAFPRGLMADVTAMIAVSAMASQYSLLQLALPGAPSTAVMTGNLTKTVLAFLETASERQPLMKDAKAQLRKTLDVVTGFFVGCLLGAGAVSWFGDWAWAFPVVLAGIAWAVVAITRTST